MASSSAAVSEAPSRKVRNWEPDSSTEQPLRQDPSEVTQYTVYENIEVDQLQNDAPEEAQ